MHRLTALGVVVALASTAAAEAVKAPVCGEPVANRPAPRGLADVDWCNHDFHFGKGALRRGTSSLHLYRKLGEAHDTIITTLRGVVYGDLDGDGKREAAIILERTTWTARSREPAGGLAVYIYDWKSAAPRLLGSVGVGKPVHDITLAKNILTITSGTPKVTKRYRRDAKGEDFVEAP